MAGRARSLTAAFAIMVALAGLTGCGLGPGPGPHGVTVTVTEHFGAVRVGSVTVAKVPGSETVMRLLQRHFRVDTRYAGGFVESIDGVSGDSAEHDWFYYVNGVQAPAGAATTAVHAGDHIWWDLHDWRATESIPAVVGAFPEPFVHGIRGKRYPTTLECGPDVGAACRRVAGALTQAGIAAATQLIGTGSGTDSLNVLVAPWSEVRSALVADLIERGPAVSGVYARFAGPRGDQLELLDPSGQVARRLGAGAGLVAATADTSGTPTWLITGTDNAGVQAAAVALGTATLQDHFALAVQAGTALSLPLEPGR